MNTPIEIQARHQIAERITRASAHHVPATTPRHKMAERLRRFADRIDS